MHSHVLTDSIRTGGTHTSSALPARLGDRYTNALCHWSVIDYKLGNALVFLLRSIVSHWGTVIHSSAVYSVAASLRDSARPVTYHSFHVTHPSQTETQAKGFVSPLAVGVFFSPCILIREKKKFRCSGNICQIPLRICLARTKAAIRAFIC